MLNFHYQFSKSRRLLSNRKDHTHTHNLWSKFDCNKWYILASYTCRLNLCNFFSNLKKKVSYLELILICQSTVSKVNNELCSACICSSLFVFLCEVISCTAAWWLRHLSVSKAVHLFPPTFRQTGSLSMCWVSCYHLLDNTWK